MREQVMNKYKISDETFLKKVKQWIESDKEIYVDKGFTRSGGWNYVILVNSYEQFLEVLSVAENRIGAVEVMRLPKTVIKGISNDTILQKAFAVFSEGKDWWLICPNPEDILKTYTHGDTTMEELQKQIEQCNGQYIIIGFDNDFVPFGSSDRYDDNVLVGTLDLSKNRALSNNEFLLKRNQPHLSRETNGLGTPL